MPGERSPRRWTRGAASSASPSSRHSGSQESPGNNAQQQQQQQRRWRSNLSTQRRDRTVVWASCLQRVQALRRGGPWVAGDACPEGYRSDAAGAGAGAGATGLSGNGDTAPVRGASAHSSSSSIGSNAARAKQVGDELHEQLDLLSGLTYPNSSISPQDAGFMVSALCEAVSPSSDGLCSRVAQLFTSLCATQQKVSFLAWQLSIVVDFFVGFLAPPAQAPPPPSSPPQAQAQEQAQTKAQAQAPVALGRRECVVRALAQLLYENGDRLGTRFDSVVPALLGLADVSASDLEARHAALDALSNLCLKNWAGFTELQRQAVCSSLAQNFVAHWRSFAA
ncbi:unnamed protein product, partial [Laminaria digitata]